jgi:hypothetical protein
MNLRQYQAAFAQGLRQPAQPLLADGAPDFAERFDAYRNNAWQFFAAALEQTYPVLQRRVGAEFFRQLAREYRSAHPSRRGDLHWVGAEFPAWLDSRMADSGYAWLADLARLEWAVSESVVAAAAPVADLAALHSASPDALADLRLVLHPSVRFVTSPFPVWSIWQANQQDEAPPVDLAQGGEHCIIACVEDRPVAYRLEAADYQLLARLGRGDSLGEALDASDTGPEVLGRVLGWAFVEQLVARVISPSAPA